MSWLVIPCTYHHTLCEAGRVSVVHVIPLGEDNGSLNLTLLDLLLHPFPG